MIADKDFIEDSEGNLFAFIINIYRKNWGNVNSCW